MAERRMIAKSIIKSDQFLDMPATTQCLYFHLLLEADDDGFINAPKSIMRMIGAKDDDMRVLQAKGYIIPFESGVIVIKHWRLHNSLRKDRYNPNPQLENERKQLVVADNKEYQLATNWQPNGNQLATSGVPLVATGKDRLGKDRLEKNIGDADAPHTQEEPIIQTETSNAAAGKKRKQFKKPTVEEIEAFAKEQNLRKLDAQYFYDYYESNGWMVGKNHMKDWKATAKNWNRRQFNTSRQKVNVIKMPEYMRSQVDEKTFGELEKEGKCPF